LFWIDANTSWGANRAMNLENVKIERRKKEGEWAIIVANVGIK
jgi:hypothetical protein